MEFKYGGSPIFKKSFYGEPQYHFQQQQQKLKTFAFICIHLVKCA